MVSLYSNGDEARLGEEQALQKNKKQQPFRNQWRRDYARLIHSPCFRRLQGKTQVFPGNGSDFYRNRLSHSIEVAQIAKSIAIMLNATTPEFGGGEDKDSQKEKQIHPEIVEFAGLAHDLGHPPFGHNGEEALDECMRDHGGFEANAQTLRIVARLEKKVTRDEDFAHFRNGQDLRCGLNITYRGLAALLKYDHRIPECGADRDFPDKVMKGYYKDDENLVNEIKRHVLHRRNYTEAFKTIECSIVDLADDIAYSTYDLEDSFKAGFLSPLDLFNLESEVYSAVAETVEKRANAQYPNHSDTHRINRKLINNILFKIFDKWIFSGDRDQSISDAMISNETTLSAKIMIAAAYVQKKSRRLASDGYYRTAFTSDLVQRFIEAIEVKHNPYYPQLSQVNLKFDTFLEVEVLKNITHHAIIRSPRLQVIQNRSKEIIKKIFDALNDRDGIRLLPEDLKAICRTDSENARMRNICDFIAGMTDQYAIDFYSRLYGTSNIDLYKPL